MTLENATAEEILKNAGLYMEMIKIMRTADGYSPKGSCCGKNKAQHIDQFLKNKNKYMKKVEEINNRKIKPLWKGLIYISSMKMHLDAKTITDEQSRIIIENGYLTPVEKYFELPVKEIVEDEIIEDEIIEEEIPVMTKEEQEAFDKEYNEYIDDLKNKSTKKSKSKKSKK